MPSIQQNPVDTMPSSATLAVRNFNRALENTLNHPPSADPVPGSKRFRRAFFAGTDTFVKRAADPELSPAVRVVAAGLGVPALGAGLMVGTLGTLCFGAAQHCTDTYFDGTAYAAKKAIHKQRQTIRRQIDTLDRDLSKYFEHKLFRPCEPVQHVKYDLYALRRELEKAQETLSFTRVERLAMRDPGKAIRDYLAAVNSVELPEGALAEVAKKQG